MTDRPPFPSRAGGPQRAASDAPASDSPAEAVFEDIELVGPTDPDPSPVWDAVPVESAPPDAPVIQVGDPFADPYAPASGQSPSGDGHSGFSPERSTGDGYTHGDGFGDGYGPTDAWPSAESAPAAPQPPLADAPDYDERSGFRIDPGTPTSTALVPASASVPMVPQTAPAAPPPAGPPPRSQARHAARDRGRMLRRHKWLILVCTLLGGALALAYSLWTPKVYEAYGVLLIDGERPGGAESSLVKDFVGVPGREGRQVLNQALVLKQAPAMADSTAAALLARGNASSLSSVVQAGAALNGGQTPTEAQLSDYLQKKVVSVSPAGEEVDALRVSASAGDPEEAALIASVYMREYRELTGETNRAQVRATREFLEEQVMRRESELVGIESALKRYLTGNNAAGLEAQTSARVGQISQLQSQLDAARVNVQTAQARLSALESDLASVPRRLEASVAAAATASPAQIAKVDGEIVELENLINQIYLRNPELRGNPNAHPDLRSMTAELDRLRADRQRLGGNQAGAAVASGGLDLSSQGGNGQAYVAELQRQISGERAALLGARASVSALSSRLGATTSELRAIPNQQISVDQLQRRRQQAASLVATLTDQLERAKIAEQAELGTTQIVREVQTPLRPTKPNVPLNTALGLLLGMMIGLAGAATRYRTDARVRTPDDLQEHGFTVLGTIPDITKALKGERATIDGVSVHPGLVTLTRPFSAEAEAFRHLGASLRSGAVGAEVILVGGPEVGTGKSLVATNLAVAAAQAGKRVLIVDADLRKPTVAPLLGLGGQPPLGEGDDDMNVVYWNTVVPSLFALTPRDTAEAPDQLWTPEQIGRLLGNLRSNFDLILMDTPPALATADLTLVAPYADGAVLIAEADKTDLDAMTQVAGELAGAGLTRIGAVLNRFHAAGSVGYGRTEAVRQRADRQLTA